MYERGRSGAPGGDDDGFDDRRLVLDLTFGGAGRLIGDLTPGCAAAVAAVLEALGKPAGPEDTRTVTQRRHDALEEACRRLLAAKMVPGRAGQPAQALVHITLAQMRALPGASEAEAAWRAAATARGHGWLAGPDADAAACDATVAPVVTGHVDPAALEPPHAVFVAAYEPAIPAHLRRAATTRHPHCAFPGCGQPASVCQIHHLIPRSQGGPTALHNLVPLCAFHHLIVIHRWGWTLRLHPDGTMTATSPH